MSTEIKNTLFRFVTLRAPEAPRSNSGIRFAEHPDIASAASIFLSAVRTVPAGKTRRDQVESAITSYAATAFKTTDELKTAVTATLYDFASWLSANKRVLTTAQVTAKLPAAGISTPALRIRLWDELFYQIASGKSGYLREALMEVLVADLFIAKLNDVEKKDKPYRKLAQSRVAIPKEMFGLSDIADIAALTQAELDKIPVNTDYLNPKLIAALGSIRVKKLEKTIAGLKTARTIYNRENATAYKDAQENHKSQVKSAYDHATVREQTYTDKELGIERTHREYVDLKLPEFEFTPAAELDASKLSKVMEAEGLAYIEKLKLNSVVTTFEEAFAALDEALKAEYKSLLENSAAKPKSITNYLPQGVSTLSRPVFSIASTSLTDGSKTGFVMVFDNIPEGVEVVKANYTVTAGGTTTTGTSYAPRSLGGNLAVQLTENQDGISTNSAPVLAMTGTLTLSNGDNVAFNGNATQQHLLPTPGTIKPVYAGGGTATYQPLIVKDPTGRIILESEKAISYKPSTFGLKRLGIADYRKVEQEICCYVPGEVSSIENIMAREYREKSTRRLRRTEDTVTTGTERENEKLTDTTTTDRFEMNREVASVVAESKAKGAHTSFNASYDLGEVDLGIGAGADFAQNNSREDSNIQAVTQAKEITERALERVVQKVKEERVSKVIEEFEENNRHGFDNRAGDNHISGVYRWVDKIYKNRVVNYGKRLMYEFMIPEPAAFHNVMKIANENGFPTAPPDPRKELDTNIWLRNHKDVSELSYQHWAGIYNVDVPPPPPPVKYIGKTFADSQAGAEEMSKENVELEIPEGYFTIGCTYNYTLRHDGDTDWDAQHGFALTIGDVASYHYVGDTYVSQPMTLLKPYFGKINIGYSSLNYMVINVGVSILLHRSDEFFQKWQVEVFNTIMNAYEEKLKEYNEKIAELKAANAQKLSTNPMFYRQIENSALRKNCIAYMARQSEMGKDLMLNRNSNDVMPNYTSSSLESYASLVKFFEQAFEWNLMSYNFYPYYWAKKEQWKDLYNIDNDDALFRSFMQSGMARVIVTVTPGFEEAVNWYITTGQIWKGGAAPTISDPLFRSIVDELEIPEGVVEDTWESRVPTSLTVLQAGTIGLDVEGLPCNPDCDEYKVYDENGNLVNTLPNPIQQTNSLLGVPETIPAP